MATGRRDGQGRRSGPREERFSDGSLSGEGSYAENERDGPWRHYDADGEPIRATEHPG